VKRNQVFSVIVLPKMFYITPSLSFLKSCIEREGGVSILISRCRLKLIQIKLNRIIRLPLYLKGYYKEGGLLVGGFEPDLVYLSPSPFLGVSYLPVPELSTLHCEFFFYLRYLPLILGSSKLLFRLFSALAGIRPALSPWVPPS
jgi:hypothetical protein